MILAEKQNILLASNGDFAIEGIKLFFDDFKNVKLAYIITASKGTSDLEYLKWHKDKMDKLCIDYEEIDIEGKKESELSEIFKDKNVIFVEGGNTFYLLKAVRESGFNKVVNELLKKGVAYIGASAGAYIACPTIEMATWKPKQKDRFGVTEFTALNLVPFLVTAHYTQEMESVLREKISEAGYSTRVLKDGQGILVIGDEYKFIGEGKEIIF